MRRWLSEGWLPKNGRLIDFGAQEFNGDQTATFADLTAVLGRQLKQLPSVGEVYRELGIDYVSIDVDGSWGSAFFDLNTFAPPPEWLGAFDMVNNEGTIEHLVNPINGFQVAHELLKVGGVAHHSMPLSGWTDHGFVYPTPKFYGHMLYENGYERLEAEITHQPSRSTIDPRVFSVFGGETSIPDIWLGLTYRKRSNLPFCAPADHLIGPGAGLLAGRLAHNWAAFSKKRFNGDAPQHRRLDLRRRWRALKHSVASIVR